MTADEDNAGEAGATNTITVDLGEAVTLSMLRVWNYNKSRAHSCVEKAVLLLLRRPRATAPPPSD